MPATRPADAGGSSDERTDGNAPASGLTAHDQHSDDDEPASSHDAAEMVASLSEVSRDSRPSSRNRGATGLGATFSLRGKSRETLISKLPGQTSLRRRLHQAKTH